jgi:hypothetical protein
MTAPKLENHDSLEQALKAKIKYYREKAEELAEDQ